MGTESEQVEAKSGPSRRTFLKWSGAVGGAAALVSTGTYLGMPAARADESQAGDSSADGEIFWSACTVNCGSRCPLRLEVHDGVITRVLPDDTGTNELGSQQVRACVRGRSIRHRIYNKDRLKTPLKRKEGTKRGEEQWEEISWEQALQEITDKMKDIKSKWGNEAFYIQYATGTLGSVISRSCNPEQSSFARLMNVWGGYLDYHADYSTAQITGAYPYFYGGWVDSNSFYDARNAKLQVMFGNNPIETRMSGGGQTFISQQVKKDYAVKTIVFDPRYSDTAVSIGDDWVPVRPGTDGALIAGMIHVMLKEGLHDQAFLDKYCVGFDEATLPPEAPKNSSYRSYIEGKGPDGIEKTPEWAANISGVPARRIRQLAREIATAKPCAITQGWGPQRHANGEDVSRAIFLLACATGNVGVPGGGTGARGGGYGFPIAWSSWMNDNPVEKIIPVFSWLTAVQHGEEMDTFNSGVGVKVPGDRWTADPIDAAGNPTNTKLGVPLKMIWNYAGNSVVNQTGQNNESVAILEDDTKCELIVTCDIQYTVSARYSDYILPGTSAAEEADIHPGERAAPMYYAIASTQAIDPLFECKDVYEICSEMAQLLGVEEAFSEGRTREEWLEYITDETRKLVPELPSYEEFKRDGIFRASIDTPVPLADFREDPAANPLDTPSGLIEIYSDRLRRMSEAWEFGVFFPELEGDKLVPLPEYTKTWEGAEDARDSEKFPLQVIGHHYKGRTHSTYGNVDWLKGALPQVAWVNSGDAQARGIKNGDDVFVYNDRGTIRLRAKVTDRIMPGVVSVPQGAWFDPRPASEVKPPAGANNDLPVDVAGSVNTLTSLHPSPLAKGNAVHTTIAQLAKA